jgi:hypothetical protein
MYLHCAYHQYYYLHAETRACLKFGAFSAAYYSETKGTLGSYHAKPIVAILLSAFKSIADHRQVGETASNPNQGVDSGRGELNQPERKKKKSNWHGGES